MSSPHHPVILQWSIRFLSSVLGFTISLVEVPTMAQITPDNSLGVERSNLSPVNVINGGARRGANLFHSFSEFNIGNGQRIDFANPVGVDRILTRVTGSDRSNILGTLGVLGNADFFLINPNGIVFGANAKLDIRGSFLASTASSIQFADGSEFSAVNPQAPPLLTINLAPGLQYGSHARGAAIVSQADLQVGQQLVLVADQLDIQGQLQAGSDLTLQAEQIQIRDTELRPTEIVAGNRLLVEGNQSIDIAALSHPVSRLSAGGDLVLRSTGVISGDTHFYSGGEFRVEQLPGVLGDLVSLNDPIIRANGNVSLASYAGASLHILAGGRVTIPGNVIVGTPDGTGNAIVETVRLSDGSTVAINGQQEPTIDIRAGINWQSPPGNTVSGTLPAIPTFAAATGADITIGNIGIFNALTGNGGRVLLTNQYQPNPTLSGNITVGIVDGRGSARGSSITLDSRNGITTNGTIVTSASATGIGGDITLLANGTIRVPAVISSSGGAAGNLTLKSNESILLPGGLITTTNLANVPLNPGQSGGNIRLEAPTVLTSRGGTIRSLASGSVPGGNITIAADSVVLSEANTTTPEGIFTQVSPGARGKGGDIQIRTRSFTARDGAGIFAVTFGAGNNGNITIEASDAIVLRDINPALGPGGITNLVQRDATGSGGNVALTTRSLTVANGAQVSSSTRGRGNTGNVRIDATESVQLSGISSTGSSSGIGHLVGFTAQGNGGTVEINTPVLLLRDGGTIGSGTQGGGNGGNVLIHADQITLDGIGRQGASGITVAADTGATGNGGRITIGTQQLRILNGGQIASTTNVVGNAGRIEITATNGVTIDGTGTTGFDSGILSTVRANGRGWGGDVQITTPTLTLTHGGFVDSSTLGLGNAGNINIDAIDVVMDGIGRSGLPSGAESRVQARAAGNGGEIAITTRSLTVTNGARLSVNTEGRGDAGNIRITATDFVRFSGENTNRNISGAFSNVRSQAVGTGGDITIATDSLSVLNGAQLNASTAGQGNAGSIAVRANTLDMQNQGRLITTTEGRENAGNITVRVRDRISLTGDNSGLFANTAPGSSGNGGTIFLNTSSLALQNRARIAVDSQGTGDGGNIQLDTDSLTLKNQASISAETVSNTGGNIALTVRDILLLRRNSLISTTAGKAQGNGDGGNIAINAGFIVAVPSENSDITANAFQGRGGNINITTQGIFGIAFRDRLTPRSDITASSEFGLAGNVTITTLGIDPLQRGADLPTTFSTPPLAQGCRLQGNRTSSFVIAGQGGVPTNPIDPIATDTLWQDLAPLAENPRIGRVEENALLPSPASAIVEAQNWATLPDGTVLLTAQLATNPLNWGILFCR